MNTALLFKLLQEWIAEDYTVVEIEPFGDELDSLGMPIPHREIYRRRYESRLSGLRQLVPERIDIHSEHQAVLDALSNLKPDARLYYWEAGSRLRVYSGVASSTGIVSFYSNDRA